MIREVATLFGVSGSLRVAIALSDPGNSQNSILQDEHDKKEREEALRKSFVEICVQRAEVARKHGAQTEAAISGEFYLSHHEIHAPKFSQKIATENGNKHEERST